MARRPAADKNHSSFPLTLQKAFEAYHPALSVGDMAGNKEAAEANVGDRLRELRQQKRLSIRALAGQSGLAINTLSMIENGKTSPSVSTLQILANTLDVPVAAFFEHPPVVKKVVHTRSQHRPTVMVNTIRLEHLGKDLSGETVQPFVVTLQPGSGSGQDLIVHTGHEFAYCLSGQTLYLIDGKSYLLEAGDSVVFESHLPHRWENTGSVPAQVILVLIPSDVHDTPAERHFPLE